MKIIVWVWVLLMAGVVSAQTTNSPTYSFRYDTAIVVRANGQPLPNAWAGGLNNVQAAALRLNADTLTDLLIFDRANQKASTFLAVRAGDSLRWQYAPSYEKALPPLSSWAITADYDGDGRTDLFTAGNGGIAVYRNESANGALGFTLAANPLMTIGFGGRQVLYVSPADLPAILDYDGDGDVDVLTFDPTGNIITYQQNRSMERTGRKGLDFQRVDCPYWGGFVKEYCNDFTFGFRCDGTRPARIGSARPLHSGNTLTIFDTDADGLKDLLFGSVSCPNVARVINSTRNDSTAWFTRFDTLFPTPKPIRFPAYAMTSFADLTGDGLPDLLASTFNARNDNQAFDFRASSWLYVHTGTAAKPAYTYRQADFLQDGMIDLGENAMPALADLDGDGDMDLVVGYEGARTTQGTYRGGLWLFMNAGTAQKPQFDQTDTDFLGLSKTVNLNGIQPIFYDFNADNRPDLVLVGTNEQGVVEIQLLLNKTPTGIAAYEPASAIRWPVPALMLAGERLTLADIDHDGKPDALLGKSDGTIHYFRNTGTAQLPIFTLQSQNFGRLPTDVAYTRVRSLVVADVNGDQKPELLSAAANGSLRLYQLPETPDGALTLLDSLPAVGKAGSGLAASLADLDADGLPDLVLGSVAGGLRYLKNTSTKVIITAVPVKTAGSWAFPNPNSGVLVVRPPFSGQLRLIGQRGDVLKTWPVEKSETETVLDVSAVPAGLYVLQLTNANGNRLEQKLLRVP